MILVDTSVWVDHFRRPMTEMAELLERDVVLQHPFVTGELLLGNPGDRSALASFLNSLETASVCEPTDFADFIDSQSLGGTGIGFVDANLLAAASADGHKLWTRDRRLAEQAERLGLLHAG